MRALMVVLPYSASMKDDVDSMQELFNKAPVTRVIESEVRPAVMMPVVTQKPATTLAFTTTTRRSSTQFAVPADFAPATFKPLPAYDKMFATATTSDEKKQKVATPNDLEAILREMKIDTGNFQTTTARSDPGQVAPDVKDVLQSLGLWEDNETPAVFSKQTLSGHFAPIELDFKTGTVRSVEKPSTTPPPPKESVNKRMKAPEVTSTDFMSFKPIPKLDNAEVEFENYEYFKSLGLLDSSKESRAYTSTPEANKPVVSNKAQGFTRRKMDVSYETDLIKKISKQEREQLLDVLKKLESQVVNGKLGPNPLDHTEINLTKKDYKRQEEASTESVAPIKFSFNFNDDDGDKDTTTETVSVVTPTPEVLSDDLPSLPVAGQGRIVNKGSAESTDSPTTTTTTNDAPPSSTTESSSSSLDTETFSLPPLDDLKLDNLDEDMGGLDPLADAMPPPEKKNGFYLLADWNSFLEVGEGKDRVEVRFSPRVGDSRLFIPVTIP